MNYGKNRLYDSDGIFGKEHIGKLPMIVFTPLCGLCHFVNKQTAA